MYCIHLRITVHAPVCFQFPFYKNAAGKILLPSRILMQLFYGRFIFCCILIFPVTAKNTAEGKIPQKTAGFQKKMKKKQGHVHF